MSRNPYIVGSVVDDDKYFIGRNEIVGEIIKSLSYEHMILIYGQRRIGKSSVLSRIEKELRRKPEGYLPISIDLSGKLELPLNQILRQFSRIIRKNVKSKNVGDNPGEDPDDFLNSQWLLDMVIELDTRGEKMVWLLDEFDDIDGSAFEAHAFYDYLTELFDKFPTTIKVIAILGRDPRDLLALNERLLNSSEQHQLSVMSAREIDDLIDLSKESLGWSREAREEVWNLTRGHPLVAQSICSKIWSNNLENIGKKKKPIISRGDVVNACSDEEYEHIIDYAWGILNLEEKVIVCKLASESNGSSERNLLEFIKQEALLDHFREISLISCLKNLIGKDWIQSEENKYSIKIPIFQKWVNEKFGIGDLTSALRDDQKRSEALRLKALKEQDDFIAIELLEKSLMLDSANENTLDELVNKIKPVIERSFEYHNNSLAIEFAKKLSKYDADASASYMMKAQGNLQKILIPQEIDLSIREEDFDRAYKSAKELDRYDGYLGTRSTWLVFFSQTGYILRNSFLNWLSWIPIPIAIIAFAQTTPSYSTDDSLIGIIGFLIYMSIGLALIIAILESNKILKDVKYVSILIFSVALIIILPAIFLLSSADIGYRIILSIFLLLSMRIAILPNRDSILKYFAVVVNNLILLMICFSNGWSGLVDPKILNEDLRDFIDFVKKPPSLIPSDLPNKIWGFLLKKVAHIE